MFLTCFIIIGNFGLGLFYSRGVGGRVESEKREGLVISGKLAMERSCFFYYFWHNGEVDEVLFFKGMCMKFTVIIIGGGGLRANW